MSRFISKREIKRLYVHTTPFEWSNETLLRALLTYTDHRTMETFYYPQFGSSVTSPKTDRWQITSQQQRELV